MNLLDFLSSPWAIQPDKLLEIQGIYAAHSRGDRIDIAGLEARLGRPVVNEPSACYVVDGVAVLPLTGVLSKRMNMFSQISGGVSTQLAERDLNAALSDPSVHSIILHVDSPGGQVDGVQTLARAVTAGKEIKPIVTLAGGVMASGGYWFGSAANAVYIEDETTMVGSIGVLANHVDVSKEEETRGRKTTEVTAGKYKRIDSQYGPLTDEGRQSLQDRVDALYSVFVGDVANHRGVAIEKVLADMADGRVFVGRQAIDAGLVDGITTLSALITQLNSERTPSASKPAASKPNPIQGNFMDPKQIAAEFPEAVAAFRAEGATAERERIQAVQAQSMPGHDALIASLMFDGKTSGAEAAVQVLNAERGARTAAAANLRSDAPKPVTFVAPSDDKPAATGPGADAPIEERAKHNWDADASLRNEFSSLGAYQAYMEATETGRARTFKRG